MKHRGTLDYALAMVACVSALVSIGMSVGSVGLALVPSLLVIVTLSLGGIIANSLRNSKAINLDGYFWALLGGLGGFKMFDLNRLLPEGGYPFQVIAAAWLTWMVVLCALVSWRDQTLLFLTLPCLALFGLVGTFDTFPAGTGLFFVYLGASVVLYARAHHRGQVALAEAAGFDDPRLLRRDSWRWMAGPEWAMASAFAIVLVTLLVAPLVKISLGGFSANVQLNLPQQTNASRVAPSNASDYSIGRGPVTPSDMPVFRARGTNFDYLRTDIFVTYRNNGWVSAATSGGRGSVFRSVRRTLQVANLGPNGGRAAWQGSVPLEPISNPVTRSVELRSTGLPLTQLGSPGPVTEVRADALAYLTADPLGRILVDRDTRGPDIAIVYYHAPPPGRAAGRAELPAAYENAALLFTDTEGLSDRVKQFAREVAASASSPAEKAEALRKAIALRCNYSLRPRAVPREVEAVDYFLFESKVGYCDLYASAMTNCARAIGLPARFVLGYLPDKQSRDNEGWMIVRSKEFHAWCEIYFDGLGWVPFDATSGTTDAQNQGGTQGLDLAWYETNEARLALNGLVAAVVLGALAMGLRSRQQNIVTQQSGVSADVRRSTRKFIRSLTPIAGSQRRYSQTLSEYVAAAAPSLKGLADEAAAIAVSLERVIYGPPDRTAPHKDIAARVGEFAKKSKAAKRT